jgi:phage terminase large subunit GpA-like protein
MSLGSRLKRTVIDKMPGTGRPIRGGIVLWHIDTAAFKDAIHYRMQVKPGDLEGFHLHSETGEDYARQIVAEEKQRDNKTGEYSWVQVANDNHFLDCEVYAAAMADPEFRGGVAVLRNPILNNSTDHPKKTRRVINKGVSV